MKRYLLCLPLVLLLGSCTGTPAQQPTGAISSHDWWHPAPDLTWQWQLSNPPVDTKVQAEVYDIDLFDNDASVVADLHKQGKKVICYISVGSREDWRPDADQFPSTVLGKDYDGWPGEKWLDIRQLDVLKPIMQTRLDLCKQKGFDAVEPDNIEIYDNDTGFPITYADQLAYFKWLADAAHQRGLAIGLKNASDMTQDVLDSADFVISEDAFYDQWIGDLLPFIQAGKPVFAAEYTDMPVDFAAACQWGKANKVSFILKDRDLGAAVQFCTK